MEDILFLVHRIPYPPNKGDKIRSFNILRYLSKHYRVHLGTFVDDPNDEKYISELDQYVYDKYIVHLNPIKRKFVSLKGFFTGIPLSNAFYQNKGMATWVYDKLSSKKISKAFLFSSPMAIFLQDDVFPEVHKIMDLVDVDSEKWFQYAEKHRFPMSYIYGREGRLLRGFEKKVADRYQATTLVSELEANLFKSIAPESSTKIHAILNGVDTVFFDPALDCDNPFKSEEKPIVFTGAMDYWANVEAVTWFADKVFPKILNHNSQAQFYIVGTRPTDMVKALSKRKNITVTGAVRDIRPFIRFAHTVVAPLRIARGIQNKVLEALAMEKSVVATPEAMEGIAKAELGIVAVKSDELAFANAVIKSLSRSDIFENKDARTYVLQNFSWDCHLSKINSLL